MDADLSGTVLRQAGVLEHGEDGPRERLLRDGANRLSISELLAVCLGSGTQAEPVVALSQRLLREFGSLQALLQAPNERLLLQHGLGPARVARLKALAELLLRRDESLLRRGGVMSDVAGIARYLRQQIGHSERELFGALFLTSRHELITWEVLFSGSIDRAHVHSRVILKQALLHNAAAVVLAHNHPSGVVEPSQADIRLTEELKHLLARVDVRVLDHLIVAPGVYVSFAVRGLI